MGDVSVTMANKQALRSKCNRNGREQSLRRPAQWQSRWTTAAELCESHLTYRTSRIPLSQPVMPPVENPVPPSLVRPPHPAARLPISPRTSDERTVPVALPGSLAPATQGPDLLSERAYSPDDDYLPPPRSDFPEKLPLHVVPLHYDIMIKVCQ